MAKGSGGGGRGGGGGIIQSDYAPSARDYINSSDQVVSAIHSNTNLDAYVDPKENTIYLAHSISGREVGEINIETGRITTTADRFRASVERAKDIAERTVIIANAQRELNLLRNYPIRNSSRITNLQRFIDKTTEGI